MVKKVGFFFYGQNPHILGVTPDFFRDRFSVSYRKIEHSGPSGTRQIGGHDFRLLKLWGEHQGQQDSHRSHGKKCRISDMFF